MHLTVYEVLDMLLLTTVSQSKWEVADLKGLACLVLHAHQQYPSSANKTGCLETNGPRHSHSQHDYIGSSMPLG